MTQTGDSLYNLLEADYNDVAHGASIFRNGPFMAVFSKNLCRRSWYKFAGNVFGFRSRVSY